VMTLEVFAEMFTEEIAPFAGEVCVRLCRSFLDTFRNISENSVVDENDMRVFKSISCLETLTTVVGAIKNVKELVRALTVQVFVPFFSVVLDIDTDISQEYLDDIFSLIQTLTCYVDPLPPEVFALYPKMIHVFETYPYAITLLLGPIENIICKVPDVFLAEPKYLQSLFTMVSKVLTNVNWEELESLKACQIAEVPMLFFRGKIDSYVIAIVDVVLNRLNTVSSNNFRLLLLELILDALWYNPVLTLGHLASVNAILPVFSGISSCNDFFARTYDKQVAILGLSSILLVPYASLPAAIQTQLPLLIVKILKFLRDLKQQEFVGEQSDKLSELKQVAKSKGVDAESLLPENLRSDPFDDELWYDTDEEGDGEEEEDIDEEDDEDDDGEGEGEEEELEDDDEGGGGGDDDVEIGEGTMIQEDEFDELNDLDDEDVTNPVTEAHHREFVLTAISGLVNGPNACQQTIAACNALPAKYKDQLRLWQSDPRFNHF